MHLSRVEVLDRASWRKWLQANADRKEGVWLVTFKKEARPDLYLSYDDIVDEALAFGWIDSQPRSLDAERSMRLVSPRNPKSSWSKVNKERAQRLIETGTMTEKGLDIIRQAKENGAWNRLDSVESLVIPEDLKAELAKLPKARALFDAFPRSAKRAILEWIQNARKPETRARRVQETAISASRNIRANQYRQ